MSGNVQPTSTDGVEEVREPPLGGYWLQWLNSEEGRVAIDPFFDEMDRKHDRRTHYRMRRDASLNRVSPHHSYSLVGEVIPRLPCRPWYNNGDEYDWEDTRQYHQPRVYQEEIDPKNGRTNEDMCYTCLDHKLCTGPVCEARVLMCTYCDSEEGPLGSDRTMRRELYPEK